MTMPRTTARAHESAPAVPPWPRAGTAPFYASPPRATPARRRMLLVFFEFLPSPAVGTLRWLRLAEVAHERGWEIDVLMLHPEHLPAVEPARLRELPPGVRLFGFADPTVAWDEVQMRLWRIVRPAVKLVLGSRREETSPEGVARAAGKELKPIARTAYEAPGWYRAILAWRHLRRMRRASVVAAELGVKLAAANRYDVVVSSGPPHNAHVAARVISEATGLPLVVDLRDPWAHEEVVPQGMDSPTWRRIVRARESYTLHRANLVVTTTEALRDSLRSHYPGLAQRFVTVRNGADPEQLPAPRHGRRFVIGFAGNLYVGRDPRGLFRAAARVVRELGLSPSDFGIEFIGSADYEGTPLTSIAEETGIGEYFRVGPSRPRGQALEFLAGATMLVSLPQDVGLAIPAKVYEYTQFSAWLLAMAEPTSATAQLLAGSGADVVGPDDENAIAAAIATRVREHRAGVRPLPLNRDGRFDRKPQAEALMERLEGFAAKR